LGRLGEGREGIPQLRLTSRKNLFIGRNSTIKGKVLELIIPGKKVHPGPGW